MTPNQERVLVAVVNGRLGELLRGDGRKEHGLRRSLYALAEQGLVRFLQPGDTNGKGDTVISGGWEATEMGVEYVRRTHGR